MKTWKLALVVVAASVALAVPAHADIAFRSDSLTAIPTYEWLVCKPAANDTVYIKIDFGGGDAESVDALTVQHVLPYEVVTRAEQYNEQVALNAYPAARNGYKITWAGTHDQTVYNKKGVETRTQKYRMTGELELVKGRVNDDANTHVWRYKEVVWSEPRKDDGEKTPVINTTCHATKYQGYEAKPELLRR